MFGRLFRVIWRFGRRGRASAKAEAPPREEAEDNGHFEEVNDTPFDNPELAKRFAREAGPEFATFRELRKLEMTALRSPDKETLVQNLDRLIAFAEREGMRPEVWRYRRAKWRAKYGRLMYVAMGIGLVYFVSECQKVFEAQELMKPQEEGLEVPSTRFADVLVG